jgi:hypothetical protein
VLDGRVVVLVISPFGIVLDTGVVACAIGIVPDIFGNFIAVSWVMERQAEMQTVFRKR